MGLYFYTFTLVDIYTSVKISLVFFVYIIERKKMRDIYTFTHLHLCKCVNERSFVEILCLQTKKLVVTL